MVWCQSFHLLPEPQDQAQVLGDMVTIPMVQMLAGFREGTLLPCLFPKPLGPVFCSLSHCLVFPLHAVDFPLPKQETPLHVPRQYGVVR